MSCDANGHYRDVVADALSRGCRLASLYASGERGDQAVRAVLLEPDGTLDVVSVAVRNGRVPSLVDLAPGAEWSEREAHDLHGVHFDGHEPMRPLIDHSGELSAWTVPVDGPDAYQIAVGPIHAGVIESGHFRLHVVGDRILHLDIRLFYKHRGLERAATGKPLRAAIDHAARACGACAVTNRVAYAHAAEQIYGLRPTAEIGRARSLLLELERLWSHLNDIAAICAGAGLAAGNQRFAALCENARQLNAQIAGHRLLFDTVHVGGSHLDVPIAECGAARKTLARLQEDMTAAWRDLAFNTSFQDRLIDIGVLSRQEAMLLGAVGPAARSAGIADDARTNQEGWLTYDGFQPATIDRTSSDVRARFEQREVELLQTFALLEDLLSVPVTADACTNSDRAVARAVTRIESPRGATVCALESDGSTLDRLHLHTGSYANWPVLARIVPGNLLPDFPLINKSFELCYACADR
jgi:Ni,Fe-hydrogenase III large subunit